MAVFVSIVCFLFFWIIAAAYSDSIYRTAGLLALIGHVFVAVVVLSVLPYGADIGNFHGSAVDQLSGGAGPFSTSVTSFAAGQAVLYAIFGADSTNLAVVNGFLAVLIPLPAAYIARQLYGEALRSVDGLVVTILFLPLPFLFLTVPMRDTLSTFLALTILALLIHSLTKKDGAMILVIVPLLAILYLIRTELVMVIVVGALAGVGTIGLQKLNLDVSLPAIAGVVGTVGALGFVLFAEIMYSLDRANRALTVRASGGAVYLEGMQYSSWLDFLILAPARAIYFQFAPFPLHIETVFHGLGFVSSVYILIFAIAAIRSLYACETRQVVLVTLVVVYLAGITGYGVINSNFGTNVRHRIPFVFLLIIFAAPVLQRWELTIRQWFGVWPDEHDHDSRKRNETHKLDTDVQTRE